MMIRENTYTLYIERTILYEYVDEIKFIVYLYRNLTQFSNNHSKQ